MACGPVVAHAGAGVALDALDRVHHVVAVGVLKLVEAGDSRRIPLVAPAAAALGFRARRGGGGIARHRRPAVRVERAPLEEEAVAGVQLRRDDLFRLEEAVAVGVEQQARRAAASGSALGDDRTREAVEGDDDVGLGLVGGRDALDLEPWQQRERRSRREGLVLRRAPATAGLRCQACGHAVRTAIVSSPKPRFRRRTLLAGLMEHPFPVVSRGADPSKVWGVMGNEHDGRVRIALSNAGGPAARLIS